MKRHRNSCTHKLHKGNLKGTIVCMCVSIVAMENMCGGSWGGCWCCQHGVTFLHAYIWFVTSQSFSQAHLHLSLWAYVKSLNYKHAAKCHMKVLHVLKKEKEGGRKETSHRPVDNCRKSWQPEWRSPWRYKVFYSTVYITCLAWQDY